VLDTLLPLLDEGRLVDGRGRHIDFTNAVVVLTSNLGAEAMADAQRKRRVVAFGAPQGSGDALERGVEAMLARVREVLRPELLGRLTDTVVFRPLTTETLDRIAAVMLDELLAELPSSLRQTKVKDEVRAWVVREGTGQGLGAREVRRALEREIIEPLTDRYMEGGFTGWRGIQVVEGSGGPEFKPLT
jgi:ATP-dependent Clp protease ATP-binding subunit ClpC